MLRWLHELSEKRETFAFETTLAARSYAAWLKQLRPLATRSIYCLFGSAAPNWQSSESRNEFDVGVTLSLSRKSVDAISGELAISLSYIFLLRTPG